MPTVYLETTIPSYLAAFPSRDLVIAAHQQITHEWWGTARERFDLYLSAYVLDEIRVGDPDAAARRLALVAGLPILPLSDDVRALVEVMASGWDWWGGAGPMCRILPLPSPMRWTIW